MNKEKRLYKITLALSVFFMLFTCSILCYGKQSGWIEESETYHLYNYLSQGAISNNDVSEDIAIISSPNSEKVSFSFPTDETAQNVKIWVDLTNKQIRITNINDKQWLKEPIIEIDEEYCEKVMYWEGNEEKGILLTLSDNYSFTSSCEEQRLCFVFLPEEEIKIPTVILDPVGQSEEVYTVATMVGEKLQRDGIRVLYTELEDNGASNEKKIVLTNQVENAIYLGVDSCEKLEQESIQYNGAYYIPKFGSQSFAACLKANWKNEDVLTSAVINEEEKENSILQALELPAVTIQVFFSQTEDVDQFEREKEVAQQLYFAVMSAMEMSGEETEE